MPITQSKVTKILDLDLDGIPRDKREAAKAEVMDYIKEQVIADIGEATSPVTGAKFKKLSKEYAEEKSEVSSNVIPNMELTGAMMDALDVVDKGGSKIEIGWFDEEQAVKAFNHTTGDTVAKRPLLPSPKDDFRGGIMSEIASILDGYRDEE